MPQNTALPVPEVKSLRSAFLGNTVPVGMGPALTPHRYTGPHVDIALATSGDPTVGDYTGIPSDAVAVELWGGSASDDIVFVATNTILAANHNLAQNVAANLVNRRGIVAGEHLVMPLLAPGVAPTTLRFAANKDGARLQYRYVSASSANARYLLATASAFTLVGDGSVQQLPFTSATLFPDGAAQAAVDITVGGAGTVTFTLDGSNPTATRGEPLVARTWRVIDAEDHGIAWTALKLLIPVGVSVHGNAFKYR